MSSEGGFDAPGANRDVAGVTAPANQLADPDFNAKVENPAYVDRHPSVLFDEAHNNFHTATGRYKPFADLITSDGYRVRPGIAPFTDKTLAGHEVLIIANALGANEEGGDKTAAPSAFSDDECAAV